MPAAVCGATPVLSFVNSAETELGSDATTIAINYPAAIGPGDLLLAFVASASGTVTWNDPSGVGWTERLDNTGRFFATRVADGSEGASVTFTQSASNKAHGVILAYRNATYDTVGAISASLDPCVAPAITVAANGSVVFADFSYLAGPGISFATPTDFSVQETVSGANRPSHTLFLKTGVSSGSTGTVTSDVTPNNTSRGYLVSIRPT